MGADQLRIPVATLLDGSDLSVVVDMHGAKAHGVAFGPLEVIKQTPQEITPDIDTGIDSVSHRGKVAVYVTDTALVIHHTVCRLVVDAGSVLGNVAGRQLIAPMQFDQQIRQPLRKYLPADVGYNGAGLWLKGISMWKRATLFITNASGRVVIKPPEVQWLMNGGQITLPVFR